MRSVSDDLPIYFGVGAFALDNVVNYFYPAPVYVVSIPISILLMFRSMHDQDDRLWFIACILCLITSVLVNFLRFAVSKDDVSDILFLALFFAAFLYARHARVSPVAINRATYVFAMLFLPALIGINATDCCDDTNIFSSGSTDIEFLRIYNQGLYRIPHVASYMLAFSGLWWMYVASYSRKIRHFAIAAVFAAFTLYTGSRTPIIVIGAGYLVANIRLRTRGMLITASIFILASLFFIHMKEVLNFLFGSFLYQYLSLFQTMVDNYDRLSRVIIWNSWLSAVSSFNGLDLFFGRDFSNSYDFNTREIGLSIWFHNDFLSVFYSYGAFVFIAYIVPHMMVIRKAVQVRSSSRLLTVLGFFISASAFVNGFYKYMPAIFFVLLFFDNVDMVGYAKGLSPSDETAKGRLELEKNSRPAEAP
jgi:hypothetical protein